MSKATWRHWPATNDLLNWLRDEGPVVLEVARGKLARLAEILDGPIPMYTKDGQWVAADDPWAPNWSEGFCAGLFYEVGTWFDDEHLIAAGDKITERTKARAVETGTHDLGFIFEPGWGWRYRVRGEASAKDVLTTAGTSLATRFKPAGRYIATWVDPRNTFVDIMMNIGLVHEAGVETGRPDLVEIARQHVETTARYLLRGDGSVAHEAWFDLETGGFKGTSSQQGWQGDSTWSRGHTWALAGFARFSRLDPDPRWLRICRLLADRFLERTPDGIPPNDWDEPDPALEKETSAAAIAAWGLLSISDIDPDPKSAELYLANSAAIIKALVNQGFSNWDADSDGILSGVIYHQDQGLCLGESTMFGDYYFVRAIVELLGVAMRDEVSLGRLVGY